MSDITVTVVCTAYNHEKYLAQCLESLVSQKTAFAYEIIVHDDASTDRTADIIQEYAEKYPDLIRPIFQTENQYSKNVLIYRTFVYPVVRGKYIAICEGDDFWTDPMKLQRQVDALEAHPEIDMCVHASAIVRDGKTAGLISPAKTERIFDPGEMIAGGGGMIMTNSIMYRKSMRDHLPRFIEFLEYDYSLQIWGSLRGGVLYLPEVMSAYRELSDGSWSSKMRKFPATRIKHLERVERMMLILKEEIDPKYIPSIDVKILNLRFTILEEQGNYRAMLKPEFRPVIKQFSWKRKIKLLVKWMISPFRGSMS